MSSLLILAIQFFNIEIGRSRSLIMLVFDDSHVAQSNGPDAPFYPENSVYSISNMFVFS